MSNEARTDRIPLRRQFRDDFAVRPHTRRVIEHHKSQSNPDRPLLLLIPGAIAALLFLATIVFIAWQTWGNGLHTSSGGAGLIAVLMPFYAGSVYVFSLGYEIYDHQRALKLTLLIVVGTFAAVLIVAVLAALVSGDRESDNSSKGSSRKATSGGEFAGRLLLGTLDTIDEVDWTSDSSSEPETDVETDITICSQCEIERVPTAAGLRCPRCGQLASHTI